MTIRRLVPAVLVLAVCAPAAHAQGIATDELIDSIVVTGRRERATPGLPHTTASKTANELRAQNLVNPEDALKYLPNLTIRKRYIGDRNALVGGRSFSTLQAPRALAFMDGYLISNFLGRFDAPRWNMIAPEEIERVDVLYGPFSAVYPGNSIGTTVVVTTRRPDRREIGVRATGFTQRFDEYGLQDDYDGYQVSAYLADRLSEDLWYALSLNYQDATSQPMQYFNITADDAGRFPEVGGPAVPVSVVAFDRDPQGRRRAVFGDNGGAIDHTIQGLAKLRAGYELAGRLALEGFVAGWDSETRNSNRTFLRDSSGHEVWSGNVVADGIAFAIPPFALAPSTRDESHLHWGLTLRTLRASGWNASLVYSEYTIHEDVTREALQPDPLAADGGPGILTRRDGTRWRTLEAQAVYSPGADERAAGRHSLAVGYHRNEYSLRNPVHDMDDWRGGPTSLSQSVFGRTRLQAVYVEDRWVFSDRWGATLGVRYEDWEAFDGGQVFAGLPPVEYASRSLARWSPKVSLSFSPDTDWSYRLSAGRGYRFPTVVELFQASRTATSIQQSDPDLKAERSDALELTAEHDFARGRVRVSLFQDDVHDTIWNFTDTTVVPSVTRVQNLGRVRTRGIEAVVTLDDIGVPRLELQASAAFCHSKILENDRNPAYVGKRWLRVPDARVGLQATWRPAPAWLTSLAVRHSGRMFNTLDNTDINPDTYGGVSRYTVADVRVAFTTGSGVELAFGIDNLTDERYYQSHPYPGRTAFVEARWALGLP